MREREVLEVVTKGLNQSEAGELLGISRRTVEVHKRRIMAKLHVNSVSELIRFALVEIGRFVDWRYNTNDGKASTLPMLCTPACCNEEHSGRVL
ncbi:MAG: LuxR family transcriptional regulator [Betaproteobacteria bacterium]|nr:LuxR family transcriptional regulator [Betaproteobacteria bacterium]